MPRRTRAKKRDTKVLLIGGAGDQNPHDKLDPAVITGLTDTGLTTSPTALPKLPPLLPPRLLSPPTSARCRLHAHRFHRHPRLRRGVVSAFAWAGGQRPASLRYAGRACASRATGSDAGNRGGLGAAARGISSPIPIRREDAHQLLPGWIGQS